MAKYRVSEISKPTAANDTRKRGNRRAQGTRHAGRACSVPAVIARPRSSWGVELEQKTLEQRVEPVGPIDEQFGSYLEDVDFGIRCSLRGRVGIYIPAAVAYHLGSATLGAWNSDTVRLISQNQVVLTAKYFRGLPRWPIMAGQLLWGILALRHFCAIAWVRGKASGFRIARNIRRDGFANEKNGIQTILAASERAIFDLGQQTGFDWYWRVYFWLLRW